MSFHDQVRAFFKKYDPARIRLSTKIAKIYTTPQAQKAVMSRLHEVYAGGGPKEFDFTSGKKIIQESTENITAKLAVAAAAFSGSSEEE
jgi:hypothetical protein